MKHPIRKGKNRHELRKENEALQKELAWLRACKESDKTSVKALEREVEHLNNRLETVGNDSSIEQVDPYSGMLKATLDLKPEEIRAMSMISDHELFDKEFMKEELVRKIVDLLKDSNYIRFIERYNERLRCNECEAILHVVPWEQLSLRRQEVEVEWRR